MSNNSETSTIIAEAVLEGMTLFKPDDVIHKNKIKLIIFRIRNSNFFLENNIQELQEQLSKNEAKIEILEQLLEDSDQDDEDSEDHSNSEFQDME